MVGEDRVIMSGKDLRRVHGIRQAMEKRITQVKAGVLLTLTTRHVRRLMKRVRGEGDRGLVHRGRGQPSNQRMAEPMKAKILRLYAQRYGDFGPTLAAEKLAERHGLAVSAETLRGWLLATGVTHFRRRKRPHRAWRPRKAHVGELVQLDGSHHDWLEGRGPQCVLMAYIDDASSRVWARFYTYEGTRSRPWTVSHGTGGATACRWPSTRTSIRPTNRQPSRRWRSNWQAISRTVSLSGAWRSWGSS